MAEFMWYSSGFTSRCCAKCSTCCVRRRRQSRDKIWSDKNHPIVALSVCTAVMPNSSFCSGDNVFCLVRGWRSRRLL